jgi:hypothetical protein
MAERPELGFSETLSVICIYFVYILHVFISYRYLFPNPYLTYLTVLFTYILLYISILSLISEV